MQRYLLLPNSGNLERGCFQTMTMILSGSLQRNPLALLVRSSKEYRCLQVMLILLQSLEQRIIKCGQIDLCDRVSSTFKQLLSGVWSMLVLNKDYQIINHIILKMEKGDSITLIYNKFCPFAQRALMTALQKDLPATFRQVSLGEKGEYFEQTYRKALGNDPKSDGKVPILIHNAHYLTQSEPVCWYLAQTFPTGASLIPQDTFQRARMRLLISKQCANLIHLFNKPKLNLVTSIQSYRQDLKQALHEIDSTIRGDYFMGNCISLIDILIYPWFQRWIIIQHNFQVSIGEEYKQIRKWFTCMGKRRSVIQTRKMTNNQYYISRSAKMMGAKL